jgi:hypothetical protein
MDPMCRMLLEKTYEAIVDAGQQVYVTLCLGNDLGLLQERHIWSSVMLDVCNRTRKSQKSAI